MKNMKIDAHQHFWKYTPETHPWITDDLAVIKKDFFPEDLEKELKKTGFDGCISVQASQTLEENDFLLGLAKSNKFIKGVVGWVDLQSPEVEDQLYKYANEKKFVGVRHVVQDEPDDNFLLRENFLKGVNQLHRFDLTYDILTFPKHLKVASKFVSKFPDQKFVLDHISKPFIKDGKISPWDEDIKELSKFENVSCKLSGMVTEANWNNWTKSDFKPYLDTILEAFGTERLMIGSDWPVCKLSGDYEEVMEIVTDYIGSLSKLEQKQILGENAIEFYGLS
ncbi:amidohydrolase family protein [Flexithrix dorotheae]|uniref:amidohydrolase family protein n=1 Tax=Flexithrix dorotheae TaxID=70993 RepID=UPI0003700F71